MNKQAKSCFLLLAFMQGSVLLAAVPGLRLIGLIKGTTEKSMAVLEIGSEKAFLKIGDQWKGYSLSSIGRKSAILRRSDTTIEVFYDEEAVKAAENENQYDAVGNGTRMESRSDTNSSTSLNQRPDFPQTPNASEYEEEALEIIQQ